MRTLLACFLMLALAGCSWDRKIVPVTSRAPVLEMPVRPQLQKLDAAEVEAYGKLPASARAKLEKNNELLMIYGEQGAETIKLYNGYAKLHNQQSYKSVGVEPAAEVVPPPGK